MQGRYTDLAPGDLIGLSEWLLIDQSMVNAYAEITGDRHWIHNDPARARSEGPFRGPIVQGFLLLSLLTRLAQELVPEDSPYEVGVNYGFDKVRFLRPVPVGSRLRLRQLLRKSLEKPPERLLLITRNQLEAEEIEGPVAIIDWRVLLIAPSDRAPDR